MPAGGRGGGRKPTRRRTRGAWSGEAAIVTMGNDQPGAPRRFPYLVLGLGVLRPPGAEPAGAALEALYSMRDRGYPAEWLANDNNYTNLVEESYQLPLRALRYKVLHDYKETQLGVMTSFAGAKQVEGNWYCPGMPQPLIDATLDWVQGRISEVVWKQRITARAAYLLRAKARPDADGAVRLMCPAAGSAPTARCELKSRSELRTKGGVIRVFVDDDLRQEPPKICTRETVTFPPEAGAKFAQDLQYASEEWHAMYGTLRNTIESRNGLVKDQAFEALGTPSRHRIRGVAAQTVFAAFALFGMNMRMIDTFQANAEPNEDGELQLPRKRRRAPVAVTVESPTKTLVVHDTVQLLARAEYSTGSRWNITRQVEWTSSEPSVATVSPSGLVTAWHPGTATITASSHSASGPGPRSRSGEVQIVVSRGHVDGVDDGSPSRPRPPTRRPRVSRDALVPAM